MAAAKPNRYRPYAGTMADTGTTLREKGWLPLFDFAYQGFARGLEKMLKDCALSRLCIKS